MKQIKWYQRRLLINNKLQISILLYATFFALWVCIANFVMLSLLMGHFGVHPYVMILFPIVVLVMIMSTVAFGLILTNRISGPMYRLKKHMDQIADGQNIEDIKLREADFFFEVIESYNRVLAKLRKN